MENATYPCYNKQVYSFENELYSKKLQHEARPLFSNFVNFIFTFVQGPWTENYEFKRMNNMLERRTSTRTWNTIDELLESKAAYSIVARHVHGHIITHFRTIHVGLCNVNA